MSFVPPDLRPSRRRFLLQIAGGSLALAAPWQRATAASEAPFDTLSHDLLRDWCDGMMAVQIDDPFHRKFTALDVSNINYGCTTIHAMNLLGRVLQRPEYLERSRRLASGLDAFLSEPNGLLVGEGKPARGTSPRGCRPVDLGYNVEESLPCLALCADVTGDPGLTALENTRLLRRCTDRGLLHGGPHYIGRGAKPCVHHTFTHAKALATVRERGITLQDAGAGTPLPRARADGVKAYPEIATWLAARGPWRATVTASRSTSRKAW